MKNLFVGGHKKVCCGFESGSYNDCELVVSAILNQIDMFGMYCLTSPLFVVKVASGLIMFEICLRRDVGKSAVGLKVALISPSVKRTLTYGMAWLYVELRSLWVLGKGFRVFLKFQCNGFNTAPSSCCGTTHIL